MNPQQAAFNNSSTVTRNPTTNNGSMNSASHRQMHPQQSQQYYPAAPQAQQWPPHSRATFLQHAMALQAYNKQQHQRQRQRQRQRQQQQLMVQTLQQRQQQMVHMLYWHSVNRQQTLPAWSIIDTILIAPTLDQLLLPPKMPPLALPLPYLETLRKLPPSFQYMIRRVTAIKLVSRRASPLERQTGKPCTPDADFFLKMLHTARPQLEVYRNYENFLVLRCHCCASHPHYVMGCTNFVNLTKVVPDTFSRVLNDRMSHLVVCPCVSDIEKFELVGHMKLKTNQERKIFETFIEQWSQAAVAAHFPTLLPEASKPKGTRQTSVVNGQKSPKSKKQSADQPAELSMFDNLSDAVALASRIVRSPGIIFDDITDEMGSHQSPLFEAFSLLYRLRVKPCHKTNEHQVDLQCSSCGENVHLPLPALVSGEALPQDLGKSLGEFAIAHTGVCQSASPSAQRMFLKRAVPVDDKLWQYFCEWWQRHLAKSFRSCQKTSLPKLRERDIFRPISLRDRMEEPYSSLPLYSMPDPSPPYIQKLHANRDKFIVVDNEIYRELEGNRWFRDHISKHRSLYSQASESPGINVDRSPGESQQQMFARRILESIAESEYVFLEVCRAGGGTCVEISEQRRIEFVMNALQNGFPEMLRPPIEPNSKQIVFDLEYAPMVGLLHGDTKWTWQEFRSDKMTYGIESMVWDKHEVEATRPVWSKKLNPKPEDVIRGIKGRNNVASPRRSAPQISTVALSTTPHAKTTPSVSNDATLATSSGGHASTNTTAARASVTDPATRNYCDSAKGLVRIKRTEEGAVTESDVDGSRNTAFPATGRAKQALLRTSDGFSSNAYTKQHETVSVKMHSTAPPGNSGSIKMGIHPNHMKLARSKNSDLSGRMVSDDNLRRNTLSQQSNDRSGKMSNGNHESTMKSVDQAGKTKDSPVVLDESTDSEPDEEYPSGSKRSLANAATKPSKRPRQDLGLDNKELASSSICSTSAEAVQVASVESTSNGDDLVEAEEVEVIALEE